MPSGLKDITIEMDPLHLWKWIEKARSGCCALGELWEQLPRLPPCYPAYRGAGMQRRWSASASASLSCLAGFHCSSPNFIQYSIQGTVMQNVASWMISCSLTWPPHPCWGQYPPDIHSLPRSPAFPFRSPSSLLSFSQVTHIFSIPVVHGLWAQGLVECCAASAVRRPKGSLAVALLFSHLCADGPSSPPRRPCGRPAHPWPLLSERLWQLPLLDCITVHGSQVAAAFKLAYQPVYLL